MLCSTKRQIYTMFHTKRRKISKKFKKRKQFLLFLCSTPISQSHPLTIYLMAHLRGLTPRLGTTGLNHLYVKYLKLAAGKTNINRQMQKIGTQMTQEGNFIISRNMWVWKGCRTGTERKMLSLPISGYQTYQTLHKIGKYSTSRCTPCSWHENELLECR